MASAAPTTNTAVEPKPVAMELLKNYVPVELLRVVGYKKEAVQRKNAAGQMVVVEPEEFIAGEMKPSVYPGTGFPNKIWAGTVIEVPEPEAKIMRQKRIAEAYL